MAVDYRKDYPELPLVVVHLLDELVKTKRQVIEDTIHKLVAIEVTERNVDNFTEEDLMENEGKFVKTRLMKGKAAWLGIVDKAYSVALVPHAKKPNKYIIVIYGAEVETKTLNEEMAELEENEVTIPIETEKDREKAEELAEKLEECAITEFKVDEDGEDSLSIIYTNGNKENVEKILEECGVKFSDEPINEEDDDAVAENKDSQTVNGFLIFESEDPKTKKSNKFFNYNGDKMAEKFYGVESSKLFSYEIVEETINEVEDLCSKLVKNGTKIIGIQFNNKEDMDKFSDFIDILKNDYKVKPKYIYY